MSDKLQYLVTSFGVQALRVLTGFIMLRLLRPEDYGLLTLVAVAPSFLAALGDCGIARALVQYRDHPAKIVEASGMIISVGLALAYAALYAISGIYFYHFGYHAGSLLVRYDHRLPWIGLIGGVTVVLAAIYNFQMACLNRDLKFRAESVQNLIFAVALMVTGLSLALIAHWHREMGVFAVALQPLAAQIVGNVVIYRRHPLQPPRAFHLQTATMMFNYGWKVTLAQYVNNLQQSVVNAFVLVVGGVIGSGVFGRATQVSDMVGFNLMVSFDRLLHPLMRSVREDRDRLRSIFVRGCIGSMLLCGFGWAWLVGTAPDLIRVVMGPQWHAVPPVLRTVTIALFTAGLSTMSVIVVHALGKPLIWLRFALVNLVALAIAAGLVTLFGGGLVSMAAVFAITQACTAVGMFVWAIRTIHLPAGPLIGHLARLIFASGATCGCIFLVDHAHWPLVVRLIISSMVGVAVLLGIVLVIDREAITTFRDLLPRRVAATEPAASPEASETGELFGRLPNRS